MWGIIPAAGRGSRIQPLAFSKELLPVGSRTEDGVERPCAVSEYLVERMILGGANVVPSDIEDVVDEVPGIRYSAAVGIESERTGTQRLHVVAEVRDETAAPDVYRELVAEVVRRVQRHGGHRPARVLLVRAGTIPKTSSGKIQRSRLAAMVEGGELKDRLVHLAGD